MWIGFIRKGLCPNPGTVRAIDGSFTTTGLDSGIGHVGSGSFDELIPDGLPEAYPHPGPPSTANPAYLSLDGIIGGSNG